MTRAAWHSYLHHAIQDDRDSGEIVRNLVLEYQLDANDTGEALAIIEDPYEDCDCGFWGDEDEREGDDPAEDDQPFSEWLVETLVNLACAAGLCSVIEHFLHLT